jgi:SpoIID/LytB domain protein
MHHPLFEEQLNEWPLAATNYASLSGVLCKDLILDGVRFRVQCNPQRLSSSTAKTDPKALQERPCFLCPQHRPAEQRGLPLGDYTLLVNPFPVFPRHYTLPAEHQPQRIQGRTADFLALAQQLDDCVVFYNGPQCGASAPDHLHFQAGNKGFLPLETDSKAWYPNTEPIYTHPQLRIAELRGLLRGGWLLEGSRSTLLTAALDALIDTLPTTGGAEPLLNLLGWYTDGQWYVLLLPRKTHRPSCYYRDDATKLLISPASVEMGGVLVAARREDFDRLDASELRTLLEEVSPSAETVTAYSQRFLERWKEPLLEVGIVSGKTIRFDFPVPFRITGTARSLQGSFQVDFRGGLVVFEDVAYTELEFEPVAAAAHFVLPEVVIGKNFHWERTESQAFEGRLKFLVEGEGLTAVNRVPLEAYLTSVISSEMSAKASAELLKAHAVISRSWLLSQMAQKGKHAHAEPGFVDTETERIRWYDREDHLLYDVCADDHCQRYQGITKASTPQVREAIEATRGQVLVWGDEICDARFSKCCGGVMEAFEYCWEDSPKAYLQGLPDTEASMHAGGSGPASAGNSPDLRNEETAEAFIRNRPDAFCHTTDRRILEQVLNGYDQETSDFYRWEKHYTTEAISTLARARSGIDFGTILELIPVERGVSGRLVRLKVVGTRRTVTLGKELEIRRTFSDSHLYSSAFVVEKTPDGFTLHGAGWGHGVGLCQIGAAVMGEKGYLYPQILGHYYPETRLTHRYL